MTHLTLIASTLQDKGFGTRITPYGKVKVYLSRRNVSKAEVQTVLEEEFEDIKFHLSQWAGMVYIGE